MYHKKRNSKRFYTKDDLIMKLTPKETDVITLVAAGYSDKEIGFQLNISYGTVRDYIDKIILKTNARNRTHAAMLYGKQNPESMVGIS